MTERQHRTFERRFVVDPTREPAESSKTLARLLARRPSERLECDARGLAYRLEPPWFLIVVFGAVLGLGILAHLAASRLGEIASSMPATITLRPGPRLVGVWVASWGVAVALDVLAVACIGAFFWSRARSFTVERDGERLRWQNAVGRFVLSSGEVHTGDALAALVVRRGMRREAVLVGPRNVEIVRIARERWTDPATLVDWMAEATATMLSMPQRADASSDAPPQAATATLGAQP